VSNGQINRSAQASITVETNAPPSAALSATPTTGLGASFDASGSSDPDSDTLEFRFDPGDGSGFSAWQSTAIFTYNYSSSGTYNVTVEVREANTTEQFTDTATDSVSVSGGGFPS
jgi:PKD repeat protein